MARVRTWLVRGLIALVALVLLLALLGGVWWLGQPAVHEGPLALQEEQIASPAYRESADSALALLAVVADELDLPSLSVAVSVDGEPVWAAALGLADVGAGRPAGLRTRYRAGSVSKSMTGLAAAELVESGALELDAPVRRYVASFPEKRWPVTVRQLGSHTGGVRHYAAQGEPGFFREQLSKHHYGSVDEALEIFAGDSLLFEPGTAFQYSTHGFTLLSAALEGASGRPFLELMAGRVWSPFGMTDTRPDDRTVEDRDRAIPYTTVRGRLLHTEGPDPSYKWAGGGILTTPTDLVRMGGALLTGRVVGDSLRAALFSPRPLADGSANPQGYALGWRNGREAELLGVTDSLAVLHHGGASPGGSSFVLLVPDGAVAAAAMTNLSVRDPGPLRQAIYAVAGLFRRP